MFAVKSKSLLLSAGAGTLALAALLVTAPILPMSWDEGNAINRAAGIRDWASDVRCRGFAALSGTDTARHWHYTVEVEGHPSLYGIVIACGQGLAGTWLPPLTAARLGPMMLFGLAAGAMFYRLQRDYSLAAAVAALAALITMPRLFAHAHFASFDGPLTSCWILAWATFAPMNASAMAQSDNTVRGARRSFVSRPDVPRWRFALAWGVALRATMSCKFTGWLAPLPFVAYAVLYGDRKLVAAVGFGLATALATFWLLNPRLWHHPLSGMATFFDLNMNRAGAGLDIPTLFFGERYDMRSPLPWYNTLVWTAITAPVGTLFLAILGIAAVVRRWATDGGGVLMLLNWLVLLVARGLPGTPVHDAERLILPSFTFLAALAGAGCHQLLAWARGTHAQRPMRWRAVLCGIVLSYIGSASSLFWYTPQWLSYYNLLIGGLPGADAAGMEATYYWDALDDEVLDWLHEHTPTGEKIHFSAASAENLAFMREWGVLRRGWRNDEPGRFRWHVVQRRPTFWSPADGRLMEHATPAFQKTIRPSQWGIGPWRLDVPLISINSFEEYRQANRDG